jgi:hypothetical protein
LLPSSLIVTSGVAAAASPELNLPRRADLQRRHAVDRADLQEVVDGAAGLALQQIAQIDAVTFGWR